MPGARRGRRPRTRRGTRRGSSGRRAARAPRPGRSPATLIAPKPAPKPNSAAASPARPVESDAANSEPPPSSRPASVTLRLPMRSHSRPATGIATSAPSEAANSASPSRAFVSEAWCCTAGIRRPRSRSSARRRRRTARSRGAFARIRPASITRRRGNGRARDRPRRALRDEMRELVDRPDDVGSGGAELLGGRDGDHLGGVRDHRALDVRLLEVEHGDPDLGMEAADAEDQHVGPHRAQRVDRRRPDERVRTPCRACRRAPSPRRSGARPARPRSEGCS